MTGPGYNAPTRGKTSNSGLKTGESEDENSDNISMRTTLVCIIFALSSCFAIFAASHAQAQFARTEDQLMEADILEAKRRASDFKNYLALKEKRRIQQEQTGPEEVKKTREAFEKRREEIREAYIRERESRPITPEALIAKLELQHELESEKRDRQMEEYRQKYLQKKSRVRSIIEKEAFIDERLEIDN
jgi:hypothetical protein